MKLDVTCMRYLTKDDYRVLTAVEMGMRNHEMVPVSLITSIAGLRHGGSYKILSTLLRYKLVAHTLQEYDGYRLSYLGYDILALHTLQARGIIHSVGNQIGVGKESDIFEALDADNNEIVIKIHRLGRTSFRAVRTKRDYLLNKSKASWLYMSRLAAMKEYAFMKALFAHGFPVPTPIDNSRHVVAMSKVAGFPLAQIKSGKLPNAEEIFTKSIGLLKDLVRCGLIHCDFNEFNLMINQEGTQLTLIDFPQMVSVQHKNATELLERDINGLVKFFAMKMKYVPADEEIFTLEDILREEEEEAEDVDGQEQVQLQDVEGGEEGAVPAVTAGKRSIRRRIQIDQEIQASGFNEEDYEDVLNLDLFKPLQTGEAGSEGEEQAAGGEGEDAEDHGDGVSDLDDNEEGEGEDGEEGGDHGVILEDNTQEKRMADAYSKLRG